MMSQTNLNIGIVLVFGFCVFWKMGILFIFTFTSISISSVAVFPIN